MTSNIPKSDSRKTLSPIAKKSAVIVGIAILLAIAYGWYFYRTEGTIGTILNSADTKNMMLIGGSYSLVAEGLVKAGKFNPNRSFLEKEAYGDSIRAIYANWALFRLRDNPERRLTFLLEKNTTGDESEQFLIRNLFSGEFNTVADIDFLPIVATHMSEGGEYSRETLSIVMANCSFDKGYVDKLLGETLNDAVSIRGGAAIMLGVVAGFNTACLQNAQITGRLIELLKDPDPVIRGIVCSSLASHGISDSSFNAITAILQNDPEANVRLAAVDALVKVGTAAQCEPILRQSFMDPSKEVRARAGNLLMPILRQK